MYDCVYSCWSACTLLDALNTTDNHYDWYGNGYGVKALQREAVAALLNASNPNVNFKYSVDELSEKCGKSSFSILTIISVFGLNSR
jgi:hypothetical protein